MICPEYPQCLSSLFHKSRWWTQLSLFWSVLPAMIVVQWHMMFELGASNHLEEPKSSPFPIQVWTLDKVRSKFPVFWLWSFHHGWKGELPDKLRDAAWRINKRCSRGGSRVQVAGSFNIKRSFCVCVFCLFLQLFVLVFWGCILKSKGPINNWGKTCWCLIVFPCDKI